MKEAEVLYFPCTTIAKAAQALKAFLFTEEPHEIFAVNKTYFAELIGEKASRDMPAWTVVIVNRGADKAEIAYKKQDAAEIAKRLGGTLMTGIKGAKNATKSILSEIAGPTGSALHKGAKSWAPIVSIATAEQIAAISGSIPKASGSILMPLQAGGCFYYQPDFRYAEGDLAKTRKEYVATCEKMLKAGVLFPRPSALIAKQVAKQYPDSFNVLKAIKKAVDPKNIMNPGKLGL
jgi:FAD/FMN-containing dehydrogenase